jgi:hypothetical protein
MDNYEMSVYSGCGAPKMMETIAITANVAVTTFDTSATTEAKTPKTQPGGYYYDEYIYEGMKNLL